jgi:hypothetical protein
MLNHKFINRNFQFWEYKVSHGSLLIRSPKDIDYKTNIDIICVGIEYLAIPRYFKGLQIMDATDNELKYLGDILQKEIYKKSVLIIASVGKRFPLVLAGFKIEENERDIFHSPFELFPNP